jgi:hypothetical protein
MHAKSVACARAAIVRSGLFVFSTLNSKIFARARRENVSPVNKRYDV